MILSEGVAFRSIYNADTSILRNTRLIGPTIPDDILRLGSIQWGTENCINDLPSGLKGFPSYDIPLDIRHSDRHKEIVLSVERFSMCRSCFQKQPWETTKLPHKREGRNPVLDYLDRVYSVSDNTQNVKPRQDRLCQVDLSGSKRVGYEAVQVEKEKRALAAVP